MQEPQVLEVLLSEVTEPITHQLLQVVLLTKVAVVVGADLQHQMVAQVEMEALA